MNKFTKVIAVAGSVIACVGLVAGAITNDSDMHQSAMILEVLMMGLITTHTVLEIKELVKRGMEK